jgi:hypothetical protein
VQGHIGSVMCRQAAEKLHPCVSASDGQKQHMDMSQRDIKFIVSRLLDFRIKYVRGSKFSIVLREEVQLTKRMISHNNFLFIANLFN